MRVECLQSLASALGRSVTMAEAKGFEDRLSTHMRKAARDDPAATLAKSPAERLNDAAKVAAVEIVHDAEKKKQRIALTILAHDRIEAHLAKFANPLEGIDRMLAFKADGKSGVISTETHARTIRNEALSQMLDVIDATKGKWFGLMNDAEGNAAFVKELFGEDSGRPEAKTAAREWKSLTENMRQRFNSEGGDVGFRSDWNLPRDHNSIRVAKDRDGWIDDHIRWADRREYVNPDGSMMNDAQLRDFMEHASMTIITNGTNKLEPGAQMGGGMRANRGNEARQIHYKDAASFIEAQEKYGSKSLLDLLVGHIDRVSRDIALVNDWSPNSNRTFQFFLDKAQKQANLANPKMAEKNAKHRKLLENLYDEVAGVGEPPASAAIASGFDSYRSINVASRLGSAVITSLTDHGPMALTAHMNGMPVMKVFANELRMLNPLDGADRELAKRAGLGLEQLIGTLNRFGSDGLGVSAEVSGKLAHYSKTAASKVMQVSGMNALTSGQQRAFGVTMMDTLGAMARKHDSLDAMHEADSKRLRGQGVSDADWSVWKLATPEDWRGMGDTILTPAAIRDIPDSALAPIAQQLHMTTDKLRQSAATKLLAVVGDETSMAVVEPGARERAMMYRDFRRGTGGGEIARSFWQFKSFSIAMMGRHIQRGMAQETSIGKAAYIASLIASTTVLGAMAMQVNEVASGRDPLKMDSLSFGLASFLKGGSLGLYGDFLLSNTSQGWQSALAAIGGPIAGDLEQLFKLKDNAAAGEVNQAGGKAVKLLKSHTPFANLWYTKAATDHLIFHQMQEHFSPGYLKRMQRRSEKQFGQEYWWKPGDTTPDRAPDLTRAIGGK
jgi:hypothetical protein